MEKLQIIKSIQDKTKEINALMEEANELEVSIRFSQKFHPAANSNHGKKVLDPYLTVTISETTTY